MNKKIIVLVVISLIIVGGAIYLYIVNKDGETNEIIEEYTPVEEITTQQTRQTAITLYYNNKSTNELKTEERLIDVKELANEPQLLLVNMLIEGPKNEELERLIPETTKVNKIEIKNGVAIIDFSKEFVENHSGGAEAESKTIYSIVNTLTQLNEIEAIKILIDGKENEGFIDNLIKFNNEFVPKE